MVLLTFLELYETLLGFVLFKLFTTIGLKYPPDIDTEEEEKFGTLDALLLKLQPLLPENPKQNTSGVSQKQLKQTEKRIATIDHQKLLEIDKQSMESETAITPVEEPAEDSQFLQDQQKMISNDGLIFAGLKFFLSREVFQLRFNSHHYRFPGLHWSL